MSDDDDMDEIDEHLSFLSRRFSKLKFKKNVNVAKSFKRDFNSDKTWWIGQNLSAIIME